MALYRYLLELEIEGVERANLTDALEDEPFPLADVLGWDTVKAQIAAGVLKFDAETEEPLAWFGSVIEVLSVHVNSYVTGIEVAESRADDGRRDGLEILKYVGRKGQLVALPLTHTIAFPSGEIQPGDEDITYLEKNWSALPRWAQDAYRLKFPELRRL